MEHLAFPRRFLQFEDPAPELVGPRRKQAPLLGLEPDRRQVSLQ